MIIQGEYKRPTITLEGNPELTVGTFIQSIIGTEIIYQTDAEGRFIVTHSPCRVQNNIQIKNDRSKTDFIYESAYNITRADDKLVLELSIFHIIRINEGYVQEMRSKIAGARTNQSLHKLETVVA